MKIFEPGEVLFDNDKDIENYIEGKGTEITKMIIENFKKFGTAYTLFSPDEDFQSGKWFNFSPCYWAGFTKKEVKDSILSGFLYYLWPVEIPPYTELWLQKISSVFPYSLQMVERSDQDHDFVVEKENERKLVNIYFSNGVRKRLDSFYLKVKDLVKHDPGFKKAVKNMDIKYKDSGVIQEYDFRKIEKTLESINRVAIKKSIKKSYKRFKVDDITKRLSKKFQDGKLNLPKVVRENSELIAGMLIKLSLIGPKCCIAFRILNPKQFISNKRYLGNFAGILRVYEINDGNSENLKQLEPKLVDLYPLAYAVISNVSFKIVTHYMQKFRLSHALRSAVAAIMARNMSHNIGSHVLAYYKESMESILQPAEREEARSRFNRYLQARMDYIAYVTTITPPYGVGLTLDNIIGEFNENKILVKGLAASENFQEVQINLVKDKSTYEGLLSFPMGELGKQALFNIFEGIARNTAKHGYPQGGRDTLQIYVRPVDKKGFVRLEIWDKAKSYNKAKTALNLDGDKQKDARYHRLIDDTGALQSEFWGMKEMRVGSLFLKKTPLSNIQDDEAPAIDFEAKKQSLCYVLNMYKFKYLLIVSNKVKGSRGSYIDILKKEELSELGKTEYKLCVIDDGVNLSSEEEMNLPLRRIYNNIDNGKFILDGNGEKEIVLEYHRKWVELKKLNSTEIIYSPLDQLNYDWDGYIKVKEIDVSKVDLQNKIIFAGHLIGSVTEEGKPYLEEYLSKKPLFIQDVSGKTQCLKTTLNNPPADNFKKKIFVYEATEAACESVIIFDERLWKRYRQEKDYPKYLQQGQKVIIANLASGDEAKLNSIEFKDLEDYPVLTIKKKNSSNFSFKWKKGNKYTFASFHLGIIEKISEIFHVNVSIIIENLSLNTGNTFEYLVIHTARGKTLKYDRPLLYMDLTSLQRGVEEGKMYLVQTLYSLKPSKRG